MVLIFIDFTDMHEANVYEADVGTYDLEECIAAMQRVLDKYADESARVLSATPLAEAYAEVRLSSCLLWVGKQVVLHMLGGSFMGTRHRDSSRLGGGWV